MEATTVATDELLGRLDALDVDRADGATTSAYADLDSMLNLNAIAIGLGLESVAYEPDRFPGLVYRPGEYEQTVVVVFGNGTLFVDSGAPVGVDEIVDDVTDRLVDLGLLDEPSPTASFSLSPTEVPVPPEYGDVAGDDAEVEADADVATDSDGDAAETCDNCGHALTGEESFCPECGEEIRSSCPECGFELSGSERFCPECGTAVASD